MEEIYQSYKTIIEMVEDRKYIIPNEYKEIDLNTFKYLYNTDNGLDIFIKEHSSEQKKLYIKFTYENYKPSSIKKFITDVCTKYLNNKNDKLLLILNDKPNNAILKISKESMYNMVDIFWTDILQFNITKHKFVPKHELLSNNELKFIMTKYKIINLLQFPIILKSDPVIRYYDFPSGSVCKITRPSVTTYEHIYYRYIK